MALWLGFFRVLRDAGVMANIARALAPIMKWLFPAIPSDHPAIGAMVMNMTSNVLGLGNAATPFDRGAPDRLDGRSSERRL